MTYFSEHKRAILDLLEQGLAAAGAVAVPIISAHATLGLIPWKELGGVSGGAFVVTVPLGLATYFNAFHNWGKLGNGAAQVAAAFIAAVLGLVGSDQVNLLNIDYVHVLNAATVAAFLVLVKVVVASSITGGPSLQRTVVHGQARTAL